MRTRISSRQGPHACALIARLGSVHIPRERVMDTSEKESPLPIYNLEVEGRQYSTRAHRRIGKTETEINATRAHESGRSGPTGPTDFKRIEWSSR
ncbi:hypothetical protein CRG98_016766 [Punica granatum]|uniref:Uncharacterized protein n=1 Tax=Punica granatum TaxID=22663 RepID=A0A2I0K2N7_PUNGR|nr:hypothetical protein CRG98_016766 [Punica granatum]